MRYSRQPYQPNSVNRQPWALNKKYTKEIAFFIIAALAILSIPLFSGRKDKPVKTPKETPYVETRIIKDDVSINVLSADTQEVTAMPLEDYLIHVVAGEMPASYEREALKAQAVAARTYTAYKHEHGGCNNHNSADICNSPAHCQAFNTTDEMKEKWGDAYEENYAKIKSAVEDTQGEILVYDGAPINALFHSASGGRTEDVENVFSSALPYLIGVDSPEEEDLSSKTFTVDELLEVLAGDYNESGITKENVGSELVILSRYTSGQVENLRIGSYVISGTDARVLFGLRSANFKVSVTGETILFEVSGYGHGVGMSQKGANKMAKEGISYREILSHYYTDINWGEAAQCFSTAA